MKILILSDVNSPHTVKWVKGLVAEGLNVQLFSLSQSKNDWYTSIGVNYKQLSVSDKLQQKQGISQKLVYLKGVKIIKKMIAEFKPDILHAHYATSYGLLGRLVKFRPFVVSFWGSDIQDFASRGKVHKKILEYILSKKTTICVTSKAMAEDVTNYFSRESNLIPFGIKRSSFSKKKEDNSCYTIGTVKSLEDVYGIDILIRAYALYKQRATKVSQLFIYGKGTKKKELEELVNDLGLSSDVHFKGYVEHVNVSKAYQSLDVYVALSHRESFGVAVLEASACHLPVITSKASGFKEVVREGETGFLLENDLLDEIADKFLFFEQHKERERFGEYGARFVAENYDFNQNVIQQVSVYKKILESKWRYSKK